MGPVCLDIDRVRLNLSVKELHDVANCGDKLLLMHAEIIPDMLGRCGCFFPFENSGEQVPLATPESPMPFTIQAFLGKVEPEIDFYWIPALR